MSEKVYINDDYGNRIPMLDDYGNLSLQVIMLYAEDKLTEADRKAVNEFAATDELSRDALDGYALTSNASKTRHKLGELNSAIQKASGAGAVVSVKSTEPSFDYRKLAAAIALLVVVGGGTFFTIQYLNQSELAQNDAAMESSGVEQTEIPTIQEREMPSVYAGEEMTAEQDSQVNQNTTSITTSFNDQNGQGSSTVIPAGLTKDELQKSLKNKEGGMAATAERAEELVINDVEMDVAFEDDHKSSAADADRKVSELLNRLDAQKKQQAEEEANAEKARKKEEKSRLAESEKKKELAKEEASNKREEESKSMREAQAAESKRRQSEEMLAAESAARSSMDETVRPSAGNQGYFNMDSLVSGTTANRSQSAKYPGGDIAMYKFIEKKKNYTEAMKAQNIAGVVTVEFVVNEDGRVTNVQLKKSSNNGQLNEDALRIVRSMPKWTPAKNEAGQNISSNRTVVIKYGEN